MALIATVARGRRTGTQLLLLCLVCAAPSDIWAAKTQSYLPFSGVTPPYLAQYTTFDTTLGTLDRVHAKVTGSFTGQLINADGGTGGPVPWSADFTHSFGPHTGSGFSAQASLFEASGSATAYAPIPINLSFFYEFDTPCGGGGSTSLIAASGGSTPHVFTPGSVVSVLCSDLSEPLGSGTPTSTDAVQLEFLFDADPTVGWFGSLPIHTFTTWMEYEYTPLEGNALPDADFENQDLSLWQIGGSGSAQVKEYPQGTGNDVAVLITGSPVSLSRLLDTPNAPFDVSFEYAFPGSDGDLDVSLGGELLTSVSAAGGVQGSFTLIRVEVANPALLGQFDETLSFVLDGPTASEIYLDNVIVSAVPEPGPGCSGLTALAALGFLARVRRPGTRSRADSSRNRNSQGRRPW